MDEIQRIEQLRKELHEHNYRYYVLNQPTIGDQEFDFLMHELQDLEAKHPEMADENSPTQRVGSDLNAEFAQVEHKYPMLSLANTYNEQDVADWYESVKKGLAGEDFEVCCEMKYDGLSISLTYVDGKLTQAVTRGDGVHGDDVTANVKTIRSIPLVLTAPASNDLFATPSYPHEFEIRGEILMPWDVFERLNKEREAGRGAIVRQSEKCGEWYAEESEIESRGFAPTGCLPLLSLRRGTACRRTLREPGGGPQLGLQDIGGYEEGEDVAGDLRLYQLLGHST